MIPPSTTPNAVSMILVFSNDNIIYTIKAMIAIGVKKIRKVVNIGNMIPKYSITIFSIINITSTITTFFDKNVNNFINIEFPISRDILLFFRNIHICHQWLFRR